MDGENNGKPYEQMDDLGVPLFWKHPYSRLNLVANLDPSMHATGNRSSLSIG